MKYSTYFWDGLQHFIFGLFFLFFFNRITRKNFFRNSKFLIGLVFSSSALFFLPSHVHLPSFITWIYHFFHYPFPDWDILILGIKWHRFFITHSLFVPVLLTILFLQNKNIHFILLGVCIGLSSHLVWDAITCSMRTAIVFIPEFWEINGYWGKGWLIVNGILLFSFALYLVKSRLVTK